MQMEKENISSKIAEDLFDGYRGGSGPTSVQSEIRRFSAIRDEIMLKSQIKLLELSALLLNL